MKPGVCLSIKRLYRKLTSWRWIRKQTLMITIIRFLLKRNFVLYMEGIEVPGMDKETYKKIAQNS
jgi:hypothetical protein